MPAKVKRLHELPLEEKEGPPGAAPAVRSVAAVMIDQSTP